MRKVKFAFLFVLILCLTAAMFVACNPSSDGGNDVPSIPTPEPGQPGQSQEMQSIGGTDAWNMMVDAAKASNSDTGSLVTLDYIVNFDYVNCGRGTSTATSSRCSSASIISTPPSSMTAPV